MTDGGWIGENPFAEVDAKLTMFALANGVDLSKADDYRRLEWYAEGRERAILIDAAEDGALHVSILSWRSGDAQNALHAPVGENVPPEDLMAVLEEAVEAANAL